MKEVVTRSISGVLFIAVIVGALLLGGYAYILLFGGIMLIMMHEYFNISLPDGALKWQRLAALATGAVLFALIYAISGGVLQAKYLLIPVALLLCIYIGNLYTKEFNRQKFMGEAPDRKSKAPGREENGYGYSPVITNALLYIALPFSLTSIAGFLESPALFNGKTVLGFFIMLWASDVGAYCFGCTIGKFGPRLFPSVSPKKSWIGSIGGVLCALAAAAIMNSFTEFLPFDLKNSLIVAALISIGGGFGDLVESQLKRNFGVKDSGSIMPGHGGMLDRFDGALIGFPMAIIYLELFLK